VDPQRRSRSGDNRASEARIPVMSVAMATTQPWPAMRTALDSIYDQARGVGAELLVVDGDGRALPEDHGYNGLRWLRRPGATVFQLRAIGLAEARGEIVAVTEDHCRVAPNWCETVLRAHREHPEAAMIGGVVENSADKSSWDRAGFFISGGAHLPPIPNGEREQLTGQANISYKRWALPKALPLRGIVEADYMRELRAIGGILLNDDRLIVSHYLPLGVKGTLAIHYHDGRTSAGFTRESLSGNQRACKAALCMLIPVRAVKDSLRIVARMVVRKPAYRWQAILAWPQMLVILHWHIAGELMGYLYGPGDSPRNMR
jgi:hypothetical protein